MVWKKPKIHPYYTWDEFRNLPYGKKKAAFVVWLMRKGTPKEDAIKICGYKFKCGHDPFPPDDSDTYKLGTDKYDD